MPFTTIRWSTHFFFFVFTLTTCYRYLQPQDLVGHWRLDYALLKMFCVTVVKPTCSHGYLMTG